MLVDVNKVKVIELAEHLRFEGKLSFSDGLVEDHVTLQGGLAQILDGPTPSIQFSPNFGFRGSTSAQLFIKSSERKFDVIKLIFEVRNPLRDLQPSIAVRSAECLLCHAKVKGDVISDFGYKSSFDLLGKDYFLKNRANSSDNYAYSPFHSAGSPTNAGWTTSSIDGRVILPKITFDELPNDFPRSFLIARDYVEQGANKVAATFREYMEKVVFPKSVGDLKKMSVLEKDLIYIGAPTSEEIIKSGQLDDKIKMKFAKGNDSSPELSGFVHFSELGKDFYTNDPGKHMICEGDLFVDGVIWLNHLKIESEEGCRIHSTKTVFITGPIEYIEESALTNLQIQSSRAIILGGGMCIDCYQNQNFGTNFAISRINNSKVWGAKMRHETEDEDRSQLVREDFLKVSSEGPLVRAPAGTTDLEAYYSRHLQENGVFLVDPTTPFLDQSDIAYRRLLLNSPVVSSRYKGDFQGWVIAEFAIWRLGQFTFKYDPVFKVVPIFPLMDIDQILKVE
ncbi:hypothetical protein GW916_12595 [bacterium]|nr:hypothetical protein [bacterium]